MNYFFNKPQSGNEYFKTFDTKTYANTLNNKIVKCLQRRTYSAIYGNMSLSSHTESKCEWTFKIKTKIGNSIYIGISSSYYTNHDCFTNRNSSNYALSINGTTWSKGINKSYCPSSFHEGDIIKMILDCKLKQISFIHNGKNLGIAHRNIDCNPNIKYKMAIIMSQPNDELELIEFKSDEINNDQQEEKKKEQEIEIRLLKEENRTLTNEINQNRQILQDTITNSSV